MRYFLAIALMILIACNNQQQSKPEQTIIDSSGKTISADIEDTADAIVSVNVHKDSIGREKKQLLASLASFIPVNYSILDTCTGDLNRDQYMDMILVLKKNGEDSTFDMDNPEKRPLLILLGQQDQTYQLARRNDNSVLCVECGGVFGDPFAAIVIKNGFFTVEHYGGSNWRWEKNITYKYVAADDNWYLHKISTLSYHTADPEKTEQKVYTTKDFGKIAFENFNIYQDER